MNKNEVIINLLSWVMTQPIKAKPTNPQKDGYIITLFAEYVLGLGATLDGYKVMLFEADNCIYEWEGDSGQLGELAENVIKHIKKQDSISKMDRFEVFTKKFYAEVR